MATQLTVGTASTVDALVEFNTSFASTIIVGAPYQGNMRQLANDRWNFMYPS